GRGVAALRGEVDEPARSPAAEVDVLNFCVIARPAKQAEAISATASCASEARLLRGVYPRSRRRRDPGARNDAAYAAGVFRFRKSRGTSAEYLRPSFLQNFRYSMRGARWRISSEVAAGCARSLPGISSIWVLHWATNSRVTQCTNSGVNMRSPIAMMSARSIV